LDDVPAPEQPDAQFGGISNELLAVRIKQTPIDPDRVCDEVARWHKVGAIYWFL
jgi:hypothetical protein